mmetsp:Transcript_22530/g.62245  ORF Transcript_22530/g.62245 Transcript_22530/m.62245 type:complete len:484 (+) Transcript_22530:283-1734(+)
MGRWHRLCAFPSSLFLLLLLLAPSRAYLVAHVCDDSPASRLSLINIILLGRAVRRDVLYCAAGRNEFIDKYVVPEVQDRHGVKFLPPVGTDITACSLKSGSELMQDPTPLYGATCLEIKEPLLLIHHFMRTHPELIYTARALFRLTSGDFMGQNSFLHRSKQFVLLEYLTENKAAEVCSMWPSVPSTQGLPCEHPLPSAETLQNLGISLQTPIKVYSKDNQPTQAQQEHVTSLKAAGFNVAWVPEPTLQKIMQLVDVASHYIAHPLSPEGSFFALQRRLLQKWSSFYDTGASHLDVFLPVIQFPWLVLNNVTAIPPNRPLSRYQLLTVADIHADPAYFTQFHVVIVSLPETFIHTSKLPYLHPDIPGTACQACGHGLAFCRPSELSLPATRALFKQGHKLSTACSLVSVFPWDGSTQMANAIHVPVQYQHYTEYYEHAFCAPNAMCLPSFRRHLCLLKDSFGYTDQPRQAKILTTACRALHQV